MYLGTGMQQCTYYFLLPLLVLTYFLHFPSSEYFNMIKRLHVQSVLTYDPPARKTRVFGGSSRQSVSIGRTNFHALRQKKMCRYLKQHQELRFCDAILRFLASCARDPYAVSKFQLQRSISLKSRFAGIFPGLFVRPGPIETD